MARRPGELRQRAKEEGGEEGGDMPGDVEHDPSTPPKESQGGQSPPPRQLRGS